MPHIFRNTVGGFIYLSILFVTASVGSVLIMAPLMPLMILYPVFYRKIMDNLMGLWLILPVGLIGWAMQVAMYIFLARKWEVDQPWIKMMLDYFRDLKYKAQILIFPEGTDLTPKSKSRSDSYAKKNSLQYYDYVLHPRTTGFVYVTQTMRQNGIIDAIYDVTVGYPCQIPLCGELDSLYGNFPDEVHFHIRRHPIATIPISDEGVEKWCQEKWREKETVLEKFYTQDKCFHDDRMEVQNGSTNNIKAKHTTISKGVLWSVLVFWVVFAIFAPTLLWYSSVARYHLLIGGCFLQVLNFIGGTEVLTFSAMNWRYGNRSKLVL